MTLNTPRLHVVSFGSWSLTNPTLLGAFVAGIAAPFDSKKIRVINERYTRSNDDGGVSR